MRTALIVTASAAVVAAAVAVAKKYIDRKYELGEWV